MISSILNLYENRTEVSTKFFELEFSSEGNLTFFLSTPEVSIDSFHTLYDE